MVPNTSSIINKSIEAQDNRSTGIKLPCEYLIPGLTFVEQHRVEFNNGSSCYVLFARNEVIEAGYCPHCGCNHLYLQQIRTRIFRHIPIADTPCFVVYRFAYFRCSGCRKSVTPPNYFTFGNLKCSQTLCSKVIELFKADAMLTDKAIAYFYKLHAYQVTKIIDTYGSRGLFDKQRKQQLNMAILRGHETITEDGEEIDVNYFCPFPAPDVIDKVLIDEVSLQGRNYITHFIDANSGALLFYAKGNSKSVVRQFYNWGKGHFADTVFVACDMNAPFESALKETGLNIVLTHDRFHIFKNINEQVELAFNAIVKTMPRGDAKHLNSKESIFLLTAKSSSLGADELESLRSLLELSEEVKLLHSTLQELYQAFDNKELDQNAFECKIKDVITELLLQNEHDAFAKYSSNQKLKDAYLGDKADKAPEEPIMHNCTAEEFALFLCTKPAQERPQSKVHLNPSPLCKIANFLHKHLVTICSYARTRQTSSPIEGFNNLFKSAKHQKFGIKKLLRFELRLKFRSLHQYKPNLTLTIFNEIKSTQY